jgi:hypothetical protein
MKRVALIPVVIALTVILCSPVSFVPVYSSAQHGGLVCYCCSGQGMTCNCKMFSCPKCGTDTGSPDYDWSPELVRPSFEMAIHFQPVFGNTEPFPPPRTIYLKVPVKPPNTLPLLPKIDC